MLIDRRDDLAAMPPGSAPRVAVVHDYLTQRGGAERVALVIMDTFRDGRMITSVHDPTTVRLREHDPAVETSWLNRVPAFRRDPRKALPLLPGAFDRMPVRDVDVVVCSSTGFAHGIPTDAAKVVYCHNPPRWLYQAEDYLRDQPRAVHLALRAMRPRLERWDRRAAASADRYLVNSTIVRERVRRVYGIDPEVLPPPVSNRPDLPQSPVPGLEPGFFLAVGRARGYKNIDVTCEAFRQLPGERLVVVGGLPPGDWPDRYIGLTDIPDSKLRWLYAHCAATVAVAHEDFGLTPLEGNAMGSPALCLREGGYLDTIMEGANGLFVEELTPQAVVDAVRRLQREPLEESTIRAHAERYTVASFKRKLCEIVADVAAQKGVRAGQAG
ncbi:MAG TPA: glycosyltransferase [Mycobacteriales bacterium]|nr:glycosyltransferase [Mycobacteriales bacterium]